MKVCIKLSFGSFLFAKVETLIIFQVVPLLKWLHSGGLGTLFADLGN